MGRKSRGKPDRTLGWKAWAVCICLALGVPMLVPKGFGALASLPQWIMLARVFFDWLSIQAFGKPFSPPSMYGSNPQTTASDWILLVPYAFLLAGLLFAFVEYSVWLRH